MRPLARSIVKIWLRPSGLSGPGRSDMNAMTPESPAGNGVAAEGTEDAWAPAIAKNNAHNARMLPPYTGNTVLSPCAPCLLCVLVSGSELDVRFGRRGLADGQIREATDDTQTERDPDHFGRPRQAEQGVERIRAVADQRDR